MNRPPAAPRRRPSVPVVALVALIALVVVVAVGGCAGSTAVRRSATAPSTASVAAPPTSEPPTAAWGDHRSVRSSGAPTVPPRAPAPSPLGAAGCAAVTRLYADLVAVPLGLDDDPDPADRDAVVADTARLRRLVPASVARDLAVLAQAHGAEARALDDARPPGSGSGSVAPPGAPVRGPADAGDELDQAEAALASPAVRAAVADLDQRLDRGCG